VHRADGLRTSAAAAAAIAAAAAAAVAAAAPRVAAAAAARVTAAAAAARWGSAAVAQPAVLCKVAHLACALLTISVRRQRAATAAAGSGKRRHWEGRPSPEASQRADAPHS